MSALLAHVRVKGLLTQTPVVPCTELSRTPRINDNDGRDHRKVFTCLLAGAGTGGGNTYSDNFEGTPGKTMSALLPDLKANGLLDQTLAVLGAKFGRHNGVTTATGGTRTTEWSRACWPGWYRGWTTQAILARNGRSSCHFRRIQEPRCVETGRLRSRQGCRGLPASGPSMRRAQRRAGA